MFKLEFTLKQHTPLIHFQHEQEGATLRGSEAKPKLDRFIIEKFLNIKKEFQNHLNAVNKMKSETSNKHSYYKLSFDTPKNITYLLPLARNLNDEKANNLKTGIELYTNFDCTLLYPTSYFGNEDKYTFTPQSDKLQSLNHQELRFAIKANDLINATIICFDEEMCACLKDCLPYFFAYENFGTRQSKGFGCFEVKSINDNKILLKPLELLKLLFTCLFEKNLANQSWNNVILQDYKLLKAGRGRTEKPGYAKSKLFIFFAEQPNKIRWEKRFLKKQINNSTIDGEKYRLRTDNKPDNNTHPIDVDYSQNWKDNFTCEYKYVRALLGLAEQFEFDANPNKLIIKINSSEIERFKSPITFKVYDDKIYLCTNEFPENHQLFGHSFEMEYYPKGKKELSNNITNPPVVPSSFSIKNFLEFALLKDIISNNNEKIIGYSNCHV